MKKYNSFERLMLLQAYKPTFALNFLGLCFCDYFLWEHQLLIALAFPLAFFIIGTAMAWKRDLNKLDASPMGIAALTFASKPINLIFLIIGIIIFLYGSWLDNYYVTFGGGLISYIAGPLLLRKTLRKRGGVK